jgi:hypothetical protein
MGGRTTDYGGVAAEATNGVSQLKLTGKRIDRIEEVLKKCVGRIEKSR